MTASNNELLMALRAPTSGWLAALICALDEAMQDPDFDPRQRDIVRDLLDRDAVPACVAAAADERLQRFEAALTDLHGAIFDDPAQPAQSDECPNLTALAAEVA